MTALDQILIGIEKLPISGKKKNEYMLELLFEQTGNMTSTLGRRTLYGIASQDLNICLRWGSTFRGYIFWSELYMLLQKV